MTNETAKSANFADVAADFTAARAAFARLAALFLAIRHEAADTIPANVVDLIELGQDVAGDWSNTCDLFAERVGELIGTEGRP